MVRRPLWVVFAASTFLTWLSVSGMVTFIGITIKSMGGSDSLVGLAWTAAAAAEIPIMVFGSWLLRKTGPARLVMLSFSAYALRMFLYSVAPAPGWIPVINLLQSITFATFWIGAVNYVSGLAPDNLKTTAQSLLFSMMNLASLFGGLGSGWLFDSVGPQNMFRILALFCILALVLFGGSQLFLRKSPGSVANVNETHHGVHGDH
jgi:MFS family permease